ncbi:hypothetical protein OGAPHI_005180 [Ogataea philodendri]|uniref:Uncharacterized protein n=1 Tax=Ogataea philodendri TaxID=1378263 RepID=A0A9P8P2S0_9ASCO|nr:uncharacterized protein OGAPHI_005180 [Ogataea philodendri]KAH3663777.1 hypothetical protein OGAPHI_005180 [Ogataea philodendri]
MEEVQDLAAARGRSLAKVKHVWHSIIQKYSSLGEDEQGDVLDMRTGDIVQDSGHIRSMRDSTTIKGSVWTSLAELEMERNKSPKSEKIRRNSGDLLPATPIKKSRSMMGTSPFTSILITSDSEDDVTPYFDNQKSSPRRTTRSSIAQKDNLSIGNRESSPVTPIRKRERPDLKGDDPLRLSPPVYNYDENYKMTTSLFKSKPQNAEGPLITPSKVRRFKAALAHKSNDSGNTRLKRLLWLSKQKKD